MEQPDITPDLLQQEETRHLLKSPAFVAALSGLVMGLGQMFNGQLKKAVTFFLAQVGIFLYLWDFVGQRVVADTLIGLTGPLIYHAFLTVLASIGLAAWVFNIHDAYQTANFLSFIFDRSMPVLADEEQEFVQASLNVNRMGVRVHRASSRKALFVGTALVMYSAGLLVLGARFSTSREERAVITAAREHPRDARARLANGEFLVSRGEADAGRVEIEEALKLAQESRDIGASYRAFTSLARAYTDLNRPDDANKCLRDALALYAPAAQEETSALPDETVETAASPAPGASPIAAASPGAPPPSGQLPDATATAVAFAVAQEENESDAAAAAAESLKHAALNRKATEKDEAVLVEVTDQRSRMVSVPVAEVEPSPEPVSAAPAQPQGEPVELLSKAQSNFKVKNFGEARRLLDAYKKRGPETAASLALDGRLHAAVGEWEAAVGPLERAVNKGSQSADLEKLLADALVRTGKSDQSVGHLRAALVKKPNDPEAVLTLSNLHRKAGRTAEARRLVEEALLETPDNAGLLAADFGLALDGNSDEAAYQVALKLLKAPHRDAQLARSLVTQAIDAQRLPLAHRLASTCIQINSADPLGYILKGAVLVRQNQAKKAAQYFEKASGMGSQEPELYYEIASLYRGMNENEKAVEALKTALDLSPGYVAARQGLGEALLRLGRNAEARAAFKAVLRAEPDHADARRFLAVAEAGERPEHE